MGQEQAKETRPQDITFYTFEAVMAREERHIKRLTVALVIAIIGIVVCNMAWLYAWMQFDYVESGVKVSAEADYGGNASYIGERGVILNGESDSTQVDSIPYTDTEVQFGE